MENLLSRWQGLILSLLRIMTAFLYMQHGTQKLFGFPSPMHGELNLLSLMGVSGILETVGGFLVLIGLFTRPTAFVLSGHMAFAYFLAHAPKEFWPVLNGGESAIMFCFTFLYLAAAGPGYVSVDRMRRKTAHNL